MIPTNDQYLAWCAAYDIDPADETQRAGIEGSLTDLAEGRGEVPVWMLNNSLFDDLLAARKQLQPEDTVTSTESAAL